MYGIFMYGIFLVHCPCLQTKVVCIRKQNKIKQM